MLDFHQQDGRFKVSSHPDLSNTLTSHMGTGGNNVPLVKTFNPILSTDHNPSVYQREKVMCRADTQANAAQGFDLSPTLMAHAGKDAPFIYPTTYMDDSMKGLTIRRLTPLECERLQGFPDGWTDIPWKGKKHSPNSPRYKALGNSMAVPVMRWIGEGIQLVEDNKELFKKEDTR